MVIRFVLPGEPKGKQRPKFSTQGGFVRAVTPKETISYENYVRMQYQAQCGETFSEANVPIFVLIDAYHTIPKSTSKKQRALMLAGVVRPTKKPDFDNLGKIICDSLNGIAYHDDAAVVDGRVRKYFSEKPRVEVFISDQEIDTKIIDERRNTHDA